MSADLHTLTGAYAANALSDNERLAFDRHLEACPACAREVRELQSTAAILGTAAAMPPPADLWDRVRAEALATRQLPPTTGRAERRRQAGGPGRARLRGGRRFPPLLAAAAALLVVAATSLAALDLGLVGRSSRSERPGDLVAAVLAAPDARRVTAKAGGGLAAVVVSRARGQAVFEASGLAAAPEARTYQLWVIDRSGPRPAGLVDPGGGGRVAKVLDGRVTGTEQVAMTIERRGGSPRPTTNPVMVVDLGA